MQNSTKFLFNFLRQEFHFDGLPMHKRNVLWLTLTNQLHYALRIRMGAERHVLNCHLHLNLNTAHHLPINALYPLYCHLLIKPR